MGEVGIMDDNQAVSFTEFQLEGKWAAYSTSFRNFPETCPRNQWHSLLRTGVGVEVKKRGWDELRE